MKAVLLSGWKSKSGKVNEISPTIVGLFAMLTRPGKIRYTVCDCLLATRKEIAMIAGTVIGFILGAAFAVLCVGVLDAMSEGR